MQFQSHLSTLLTRCCVLFTEQNLCPCSVGVKLPFFRWVLGPDLTKKIPNLNKRTGRQSAYGEFLKNFSGPLLHLIKNSVIVQKKLFLSHFVPCCYVNEWKNFQVKNMIIVGEKWRKVSAILYGLLWRKTRRSNTSVRNSSVKLLDEKFWKKSWANSSITSSHWFFFSPWNHFLAELWLGKKGSFTEESEKPPAF